MSTVIAIRDGQGSSAVKRVVFREDDVIVLPIKATKAYSYPIDGKKSLADFEEESSKGSWYSLVRFQANEVFTTVELAEFDVLYGGFKGVSPVGARFKSTYSEEDVQKQYHGYVARLEIVF